MASGSPQVWSAIDTVHVPEVTDAHWTVVTSAAERTEVPVIADALRPRDEPAQLQRVVRTCGYLATLAAQPTDLAVIARVLFESIGTSVVVLDRGLEVTTSAGVAEPEEFVARLRGQTGRSGLNTLLAAAARSRRALTVPGPDSALGWVVLAPISVGDGVAAYLITTGARDHEISENLRLMVIEHAAMVCGVVLGRSLVVEVAASRARQQLFEGLLHPGGADEEELELWARHLGLEPGRTYTVMSLAVADPERLAALATVASRVMPDAVVMARPEEVVAVLSSGDGEGTARALAGACVAAADRRRIPAVAVGLGDPCRSAAEIAQSYHQARLALAASERTGQAGAVTAFGELGVERLFLRVPDVRDLRTFATEVLGKLLDGPGAEFLATLAAYFEENGSPQRVAKRLHIHPNTVTYRIRRVEDITGLSMDTHRERLMAEVAVEILAALGEL